MGERFAVERCFRWQVSGSRGVDKNNREAVLDEQHWHRTSDVGNTLNSGAELTLQWFSCSWVLPFHPSVRVTIGDR
jgi:hypothetical protein